VWLRIEDDAPPFDTRDHWDHERRLRPGPIPSAEGGLGIFLALSAVDEFRYERIGGRNHTMLIMWRAVDDVRGLGLGLGLKGGNDARDTCADRR
jgi:serine/threonine-protein kinase RsbW